MKFKKLFIARTEYIKAFMNKMKYCEAMGYIFK
jgi:hypothetical protein